MKCNSSYDVASSTTGCPLSTLPTKNRSAPAFPTIVAGPPTISKASAVHSPTLGGKQIHTRGARRRRRQTPRRYHVPPVQLEFLLDMPRPDRNVARHGTRSTTSLSPPDDDPLCIADERNDVNQGCEDERNNDDGSASVASSLESDWIDDTVKYSPPNSVGRFLEAPFPVS